MDKDNRDLLMEIKDLLKVLSDDQQELSKSMKEIMEKQKRLSEEVRLNNIVLNTITHGNEVLN